MSKEKHLAGREKVTVAIVQRPPMYMDKNGSIDIACESIIEAGRNEAELVGFSEAWVSGYPFWTEGWEMDISEWGDMREIWQDNAIVVPSRDTDRLAAAAREGNTHVVIGFNEMDERPNVGTIYNALLFIDRCGSILGTHRKLIPTFSERTFWGQGGSGDLKVFDTDIGRIGGLICGEHWMPLVKAGIIMQGQDFHIAAWPGALGYDTTVNDSEPMDKRGSSPVHCSGRQYACDSNAFCLNACGLYLKDKISDKFPYPDKLHMYPEGGSTVFGPSGQYLSGPDYNEGILYAVCEASSIKCAKAILDSIGHYSRPDCFHFEILAPNRQNVLFAPEYRWHEAGESQKRQGIKNQKIKDIAEKYEIDAKVLGKAVDEIVNTRD